MALKLKKSPDERAQFTSEVPLEECVRRLVMLENEQQRLTLNWHSRDQVDFTFKQYEIDRGGRETLRIEITGTLVRWQEQHTRVACNLHEYNALLPWLIVMGGGLAVTLIVVPLIVLYVVQADSVNWLLILGAALVLMSVWLYLAVIYAPADDTPDNLLAQIEDVLRY
jgi:hypothetical protein